MFIPAATTLRPLPRPDRDFYFKRVISRKGVISAVRKLNYDTMEITVRCGESDGVPTILANAGQYATLTAEAVGSPRAFSFCRSPANNKPNEHSFLVRLVPGGRFSGWLFKEDRTGEPMTVTGALGTFGLDNTNNPIVCIAGGSGISGIKALLEDAADRQVARDCLFVYGARTQRDLYYNEEMRAIKNQWHPNHRMEFVQVLSEEPVGSNWEGPRGLVADHFKKTCLDSGRIDRGNSSFFLCGPPPMVEATETMLQNKGIARNNIYFDKFEDGKSASPVIDNTKCVLCEECLYVRPVDDCIVEISTFSAQKSNGNGNGYALIQPGDTPGLYYKTLLVNDEKCIRCFACVEACPVGAFAHQDTPQSWSLSGLHR